MGTLASELAPVAAARSEPRVYVDANMPTGAVGYMRATLRWDVFFVLDHDYENDRLFPPAEGAGVIVFSAPDEIRLRRLLQQVDREVFRLDGAPPLPLAGRTVRWDLSGPAPVRA